jgi:alpha-amylase
VDTSLSSFFLFEPERQTLLFDRRSMKKLKNIQYVLLVAFALFAACSTPMETNTQEQSKVSEWPRGVTYEIFVQSFCDSDGDGIGDIQGMSSRLDYLDELGVEAVWLMPMHPSPSYHKYDVTDYYDIHPAYGTLADFKDFVAKAHDRGIKVVIDLVVNHTGRDHPWFQEAMKNSDSPYRDFYVWAEKDSIADEIAKKAVTQDSDNITQWHDAPGNEQSYYGFFWGGMPDLNFDNEAVRQEIFKIGRFWLQDVDVDGFRLDAARHIFPDDRPEDNHQWWIDFKNEMQQVKEDVYLVGEVWADAETVAPYTKGLHALFNFDMSYAITDVVRKEEVDSLIIKHHQIREFYKSVNPEFIDAIFLTNHDQNRIMSEVGGDMDKAKMAAALLFTMPGAPYIYYGEEIGMRGKKPDEYIREPFLWDVKQADTCRATWIEPEYSTEEIVTPAAVQARQENSLLNHYKKLIALRNGSKALSSGELEPVRLENPAVGAFLRTHQDESVLVLHNLSATEQHLALPADLSAYNKEIFQHNNAGMEQDQLQLAPYSTLVLKRK